MIDMDEETALALLFGNTKRKRRTVDLITLAKACDFLVKKYGSQEEVGKRIDLSSEMIREILLPLKLPREVQDRIASRVIDSIDVVREISSLKDQSKQINASYLFTSISSKDVRDIVRVIKKSDVSVEKAKHLILELKPKGIHLFLLDLDDQTYASLKDLSNRFNLSPAVLVKGLLHVWLKSLEAQEGKK